jgi:hypothetical protein
MKTLSKSAAQSRWVPLSAKLDRLRSLLHQAQTWGQADHSNLAERIKAAADEQQALLPRTARVSRQELENAASDRLRSKITEKLKSAARPLSKEINREFQELRGLIDTQKRAIRSPRPPAARFEEHERFGAAPEARSSLVELTLLNARLARSARCSLGGSLAYAGAHPAGGRPSTDWSEQ